MRHGRMSLGLFQVLKMALTWSPRARAREQGPPPSPRPPEGERRAVDPWSGADVHPLPAGGLGMTHRMRDII